MSTNKDNVSAGSMIVSLLVLLNALIAKISFIEGGNFYWALIITMPLLLIAGYDNRRGKRVV